LLKDGKNKVEINGLATGLFDALEVDLMIPVRRELVKRWDVLDLRLIILDPGDIAVYCVSRAISCRRRRSVRVGDESWLSSGGGAKGDEITKASSEEELQRREGKGRSVRGRKEGGARRRDW
jgi:hypothetical protein